MSLELKAFIDPVPSPLEPSQSFLDYLDVLITQELTSAAGLGSPNRIIEITPYLKRNLKAGSAIPMLDVRSYVELPSGLIKEKAMNFAVAADESSHYLMYEDDDEHLHSFVVDPEFEPDLEKLVALGQQRVWTTN